MDAEIGWGQLDLEDNVEKSLEAESEKLEKISGSAPVVVDSRAAPGGDVPSPKGDDENDDDWLDWA